MLPNSIGGRRSTSAFERIFVFGITSLLVGESPNVFEGTSKEPSGDYYEELEKPVGSRESSVRSR
jgi:hypothetical protein